MPRKPYCHPCLRTGSKEIFIKKREKVDSFYYFTPKEVEGGGG